MTFVFLFPIDEEALPHTIFLHDRLVSFQPGTVHAKRLYYG
jgi:hypothetical protein